MTARVTDTTGRSALTLVLPFAVYLAAEEVHASGVVAVVVVALQMRSASEADEAEERLVQRRAGTGVGWRWRWTCVDRDGRADALGRAAARAREAVVLTWCGMRGLATLALALSLPTTTADEAGFPARAEIVVIAATVLVATLLLPGLHAAGAGPGARACAEDADAEHAAEQVVAQRARQRGARPDGTRRSASRTCPRTCRPPCTSGWHGSAACCAASR